VALTLAGNSGTWRTLMQQPWLNLSDAQFSTMNSVHVFVWHLALAVFLLELVLYAGKFCVCRTAVFLETLDRLRAPVFFMLMLTPCALVLNSPRPIPKVGIDAAFYTCFVFQMAGTSELYRHWMFDVHRGLSDASPSFLLGVVGWIFCALLASNSQLYSFAWFCLVIGMLMYFTIILQAMPHLTDVIRKNDQRWTVCLMMAPPAMASLAYANFRAVEVDSSGTSAFGVFVLMQHAFLYISLSFAVLIGIEFALNYRPKISGYSSAIWSMGFPTAALASAALTATNNASTSMGTAGESLIYFPIWGAIAVSVLSILVGISLGVTLAIALMKRWPIQDGDLSRIRVALDNVGNWQCPACGQEPSGSFSSPNRRSNHALGLSHSHEAFRV